VVAVDTPQTRDVLSGAGTVVPGDPVALGRALVAALADGTGRDPGAAWRFERALLARRIIATYESLPQAAAAG
jgi:hypothetical protein